MRSRIYSLALAAAVLAVAAPVSAAAAGVPLPAQMPVVILAPCPYEGGSSCIWLGGPIYLDPEWADRFTLFHELGHVFDYQHMDDRERAAFLRLTGDRRPWRSPRNSPHEKFAESYATCALHRRPAGGYGYSPPLRVHRRVCALIRGAK